MSYFCYTVLLVSQDGSLGGSYWTLECCPTILPQQKSILDPGALSRWLLVMSLVSFVTVTLVSLYISYDIPFV